MKCKHCNGTGKVRGYFYEKTGVNKWEKVWGDSPCDECNGTGEIELTEQEYIQTCNTEQLAEALTKVVLDLISWNNDPKPSEVRNVLKAWLKRPHPNE